MVNLRDKNGRSLYFSNRPEYYRRKNISKGVKESWKRRKIIKAQFEKKERIRRQITSNFRSRNPPYHVSIRVLTINGNQTEKELLKVLEEFKENDEDISLMNENYKGFEKEEIDNTEEKELEEKTVYVQIEYIGSANVIKWS